MKEYGFVNTIQDKYKNYNIKVDIYKGVVYDNHFHWFAYGMCIEIDLNLRFKFYYKMGERKLKDLFALYEPSVNLTRGNGLEITNRAKTLNLYNNVFNNLVIKALNFAKQKEGIIYIDKGKMFVKLSTFFGEEKDLLTMKNTYENCSFVNSVGELIDYVIQIDKQNTYTENGDIIL